ncbi:MAG: tRNA dihydrouridine synthase DusB [Clostridiales bacterium]|nr:tRNA dihydrouridine synthase DusB [Clostridiales bacterium]
MTFKIGNLNFAGNIFLAPMAGVTDLPFRLLCRKFGAAFSYTEMISAKGLYFNNENTKFLLADTKGPEKSAVQLFGSEPDILKTAAKYIESLGAAAIDINMGCPAPKIVKNGEGCALMADPRLAGKIIEAVAGAVKIPVTVKMRKGINAQTANAVQIAKIAESCGAAALCVHGRTLDMYYSGKADLDIIAQVKQNVKIPVIGNGDIASLDDAARMIAKTGCDAVMIGRAACGNPWIFKGVIPNLGERKAVAVYHARALAEFKGEYIAAREMRKHLGWYIKGLKNAAKLKVLINKAENLKEIEKIISELQ